MPTFLKVIRPRNFGNTAKITQLQRELADEQRKMKELWVRFESMESRTDIPDDIRDEITAMRLFLSATREERERDEEHLNDLRERWLP